MKHKMRVGFGDVVAQQDSTCLANVSASVQFPLPINQSVNQHESCFYMEILHGNLCGNIRPKIVDYMQLLEKKNSPNISGVCYCS